MFSILLAAIVLGILIATTNEGDFPPWEILLMCLAAAIFPTAVLNFALPEYLFFVGPLVGAICCALAISFTLGMSLPRAIFSSSMFFAVQLGLSFLF